MPRSHHYHHKQMRHERRQEYAHRPSYRSEHQPSYESQETLVPSRTEQRGDTPGDIYKGEEPDEDHGDLDADQGEHQRVEQASLPREPCKEGRWLERHAPHDVHEAVDRIGE